MKRKLAGAAVAMLLAGLVAGCGGDDKTGPGATTAPAAGAGSTTAQFVERGDAICATAKRRILAAATKLRASSKKTGTLQVTRVVQFLIQDSMPAYDRMIIGLRKLSPPKADEQRIDAYVASMAGAIDAVKANPAKYAKRTTADPFRDANQRAHAIGFKVCGS